MNFIDKKKFVKAMLNKNSKIFVIHVAILEILLLRLSINLDGKTQIASLFIKKVTILNKYSDFADFFSKKKALLLPEQTKLNKYAIILEDGKQLSYRPIYSLDLIKLETLKIYIKTDLKNGFI